MPERSRLVVFIVSLGAFMGALDVTIVNIALPTISRYFDVGTATVSWVVLVYLLVLSSFLLTFGRIGDRRGFRAVYLTGFVVFVAGSLLCSVSWSIQTLIVFRIIQATGAAMLTAIGPAMVTASLPEEVRGRSLGYVATFAALGVALGPAVGGFLTAWGSWRWIFFVNVPVGILATALGIRVLPRLRPRPRPGPFDRAGAVLVFVVLASLVLALNSGEQAGWLSPPILAAFGCAAIAAVLLVVRERSHPDPIVDPAFFRSRHFVLANIAAFLVMVVYTGAIFLLPFYLELVEGFGTGTAGVILMVPSLVMMGAGPVAGALSDRAGVRPVCVAATLLCTGAFFLLSGLHAGSGLPFLLGSLALMGAGVGAFIPPNSSLILGWSPAGSRGGASSMMMTVRDMGSVFGIAVFQLVFVAALTGTGGSPASLDPAALVPGFTAAFLAGALLALGAVAASLVARSRSGD